MNFDPTILHQQQAAAITPKYRYTGDSPFVWYQDKCRERLSELLGMYTFQRCDPIFKITEDKTENHHRHIHFTLQTEEGYFTHCDVLLPATQSGPLPLCVCLQGHSTGAHISLGIAKYPRDEESIRGGDRDFAVRAVAEGFGALAIEQRGFGQCGGSDDGPACQRPSMTALLLGRCTIAERIWDTSRVLDAVEAHFSDLLTLDGSVCMGNSGGGTATYYIACLEDRFAGYMPSCAVCTYRDSIIALHHCVCNYVPGILRDFDMGDLAAMIAPRKLLVVCGKDDPIFPLAGVRETYEIIENCYRAAGVPENCALVVGEGGHRFYADAAWPVMKKLLRKE